MMPSVYDRTVFTLSFWMSIDAVDSCFGRSLSRLKAIRFHLNSDSEKFNLGLALVLV